MLTAWKEYTVYGCMTISLSESKHLSGKWSCQAALHLHHFSPPRSPSLLPHNVPHLPTTSANFRRTECGLTGGDSLLINSRFYQWYTWCWADGDTLRFSYSLAVHVVAFVRIPNNHDDCKRAGSRVLKGILSFSFPGGSLWESGVPIGAVILQSREED